MYRPLLTRTCRWGRLDVTASSNSKLSCGQTGLPSLEAGERVLDVGCGNAAGSLDRLAHRAQWQVTGLDLSTRMLEVPGRRAAETLADPHQQLT